MEIFFWKNQLLQLTAEIENLNNLLSIKKLESVIRNIPKKEHPTSIWPQEWVTTNIPGRNKTNIKQNHPESMKKREHFPTLLEDPGKPNTETSQRHQREGNLQTNFSQSQKCRAPKPNPRKSDPATYK